MESSYNYTYDPIRRNLSSYTDGKLSGGLTGNIAEERFIKLLDQNKNISITDMSESIRKRKVKRLRALWTKQGVDNHRQAILEPYGVTSTAELSEADLDELIQRFSSEKNPPASDEIRRLRSQCLVLMNRLGIYATNNDWSVVNRFMLDKRIAGKLLYQMNADELVKLRNKLNSISDKQKAVTQTQYPHLN